MNPEDILTQRFEASKLEHQRRFNIQWDDLNRQSHLLEPDEFIKMRNTLYSKNKQEALELSKKFEEGSNQLKELDTLGAQGLISNVSEAKWKMILGTEAESTMFPKQESAIKQYSELDVYRNKLESRLNQFEVAPGGKRIKKFGVPWFLEPKTVEKLQVYVGTEGTGKDRKEIFRDATPEEIEEYGSLVPELKRVKELQNLALQQPDVTNRMRKAVSGPRKLGISESMREQINLNAPKPASTTQQKPMYQRNKNTGQQRVSYDGGKTWQML